MLCRISKKKFLVRKISAQENPGICIQIFKSSEMIIYCRISYNCQCICHYIDHFQVFEFWVRKSRNLYTNVQILWNDHLLSNIIQLSVYLPLYWPFSGFWVLSQKIQESVYQCSNPLKWSFTVEYHTIVSVFATILTIFRFSSFESDQDMLCRISTYFPCKKSGKCQKIFC